MNAMALTVTQLTDSIQSIVIVENQADLQMSSQLRTWEISEAEKKYFE